MNISSKKSPQAMNKQLFTKLLVYIFVFVTFTSLAQVNDYFPLQVGTTFRYLGTYNYSTDSIDSTWKKVTTIRIHSVSENDTCFTWTASERDSIVPDKLTRGGAEATSDSTIFTIYEKKDARHTILITNYTVLWNLNNASTNISFARYATVTKEDEQFSLGYNYWYNCYLYFDTVTLAPGKGLTRRFFRSDEGCLPSLHQFYSTELQLLSITTGTDLIRGSKLDKDFVLLTSYPNPFNPATTISFSLPESQQGSLEIVNTLGQKIQTLLSGELTAGNHKVYFEGGNVTSGVYYCVLRTSSFTKTIKLLLVK